MKPSKLTIKLIFILIIMMSTILRFFCLDKYPPSLYSDETAQGYNAYSIMLTGRDEHGLFLPVALRSFGDWKPPLPTYLMIPFVYLFGLTEQSVRLSSALLGLGTIVVTFFLVKVLFANREDASSIALLSIFFLAISPWHILQSRSAMLVMVGLFFLEAGALVFIKGLKNPIFFIFFSLFFSLSLYSYYGLRVVMPLIAILLVINYRHNLVLRINELLIPAIVGVIISIPLVLGFIKDPDVLFGRAKTVSIFYDQGVKLRQWELITQDGISADPLLTRFFHNNVYMYGRNIIQRFLSHLDVKYLFLKGDQSQPFQIPNMGILYFSDVIFLLIGLFILYKKKYPNRNFIIFWLIISIIPAVFTFVTPSSNRTFNSIFPYMVLISVGSLYLVSRFRGKIIIALSLSVIYSFGFGYFLYQYLIILPRDNASWWNYGWKQIVEFTRTLDNKYENVYVSDLDGMPYIYFLFYNRENPVVFQKEAVRTYVADRFGFEHIESYGKYIFLQNFDWKQLKKNLQPHSIYIVPFKQSVEDTNYVKTVNYPDGKIAFKIFVTDE